MFIIICLVFTLSNSLAADVTVYRFSDYYNVIPGMKPEPVGESQFTLKLSFHSDKLWLRIKLINKPPNVTAINVTYQFDDRTFEAEKRTDDPRETEEYYWVKGDYKFTELKIKLILYTSNNMLCSSLQVAEGSAFSKITNKIMNKEFKYYAACDNHICVLLVDLKNKCNDLPPATESKTKTTTVKHSSNNTVKNNFLNISTPRDTIEITKRKIYANATNACNTNYTIIIIAIISSISGTLLIQLIMIVIWKRCWFKRNPSGTPQLPTIEPNPDPFYLNMLFRRECDQEIAEINQHQYEEIVPQVTEGS